MSSRSIPAWAGETAYSQRPYRQAAVYPRVGGGNGKNKKIQSGLMGLSPRGRGKHLQDKRLPIVKGSIPAWAGETA